jgi:hypothetical protein
MHLLDMVINRTILIHVASRRICYGRLSGRQRSSVPFSYPVFRKAQTTTRLSGRCPRRYGFFRWSGRRDSNPRPSPWQGDALPLSHFRVSISAHQQA